MHCFIRSSKSKGRAHRSLIERFWKGLDCSTMPSKTNAEGNKPFCKESHGPGHPGGGNHPPPGGGAMGPRTGHIYKSPKRHKSVDFFCFFGGPGLGVRGPFGRMGNVNWVILGFRSEKCAQFFLGPRTSDFRPQTPFPIGILNK